MLRVVRGQLSYSSPLDYGFLLIYLIEKFSFNCSRGGEKNQFREEALIFKSLKKPTQFSVCMVVYFSKQQLKQGKSTKGGS